MNVFSTPVLRQENETKSENSSKNNFKRKMTVRNSVGNQHKFAQQLPKEAKRTCSSSEEDKLARSEHIEDTKIQNAVDKLSFCCPSSLDDGYGCLLKLFRDTSPGSENTTSYSNYDYFECYKRAVTYVKQCRQLGKQDNSQLSEKENREAPSGGSSDGLEVRGLPGVVSAMSGMSGGSICGAGSTHPLLDGGDGSVHWYSFFSDRMV